MKQNMVFKQIFLFTILTICGFNMHAQKPIKAQKKLIGEQVEDISFSVFLENEPEDKDFNGKFKVLEFWATWCKPCLRAVPHLNRLNSHFEDESDLVFISITYESPENTTSTLEKVNFETIVVTDEAKKIHKDLNIEVDGMMALPRTVLIDDENTIIWYGDPNQLTKKMVRAFLDGKKKLK